MSKFKDGDNIEFMWNSKKVTASVYIWNTKECRFPEEQWDYAILLSEEFGGSWFMSFRKDWLLKNAKTV